MLIGSETSDDKKAGADDKPGERPTRTPAADTTSAGGLSGPAGFQARSRGGVSTRNLAISLGAAGILVVFLAAVAIWTGLRISHLDAVNTARTQALAAAKTYGVEVASYNYKELNHDFGVVEQNSTTSFRATFAQSSASLGQVLAKYKATSVAQILAAGVASASTSKVVAVIFVNQTVSNSKTSSTTTDQSRLEMTLLHQNGRWLIDNVTLV
jgi:Mce-associated membrane protein